MGFVSHRGLFSNGSNAAARRWPSSRHALIAASRPTVEAMESRQLLSVTAVVTNQGAAHDSFGDTTTGWTGFLLTLKADAGQLITAVDMGTTTSSTNGILGTFLQDWTTTKSAPQSSPIGASASDFNGGPNGTDTHTLVLTPVSAVTPFENSDNVHPTGAPADVAPDLWGTGTYLRGVFGIVAASQINSLPLAYLVVKNGTTVTFSLDVAEKPTGGLLSTAGHVSGTFSAPATNTASIAGNIYNDINGNGLKDSGDNGIASVKVFLDTNKNGVFDSGETSTTTASTGAYKFSNLAAGTYRVAEVMPSGFRAVSPSSPFQDVTVAAGAAVTGKNFLDTKTLLISGEVFNDSNGSGALDSGEAGLSGWTVYIDKDNSGTLTSGDIQTTTGSGGTYKFIVAPPTSATTYRVREVIKSGWRQTLPASNAAQSFSLSSGGIATGKNFGDTQRVLISGTVFNDANGNKTRDTTNGVTEAGLAGWRVFVDTNKDGIWQSSEPSTLTDSSGNWSFKTLGANTFTIRIVRPTGWTQTTTLPAAFTLASAAIKTGILFGERKTS